MLGLFIKDKTLGSQLIKAMMFVAATAAFLTTSAYYFMGINTIKEETVNELRLLANVIEENVDFALAFNDVKDASRTLQSLHNYPLIVTACLYNSKGDVFTKFQRDNLDSDCPKVLENSSGIESSSIKIFEKMFLDKNFLGSLYIETDLSKIRNYINKVINIVILAAIVSLFIAYFFAKKLQKSISEPIYNLADNIKHFGDSGVLSKKGLTDGTITEIKNLHSKFFSMADQIKEREQERNIAEEEIKNLNTNLENKIEERTKELVEAQKTLVRQAHQAGMAEMATGVLHNVGNVLNSINVSAQIVANKLSNNKLSNLLSVVESLKENSHSLDTFLNKDEKGKDIVEYLSILGPFLVDENKSILTEANSLMKNVDHVKHIIATQQSYAKVGGINELEQLEELIDDAIEINSEALKRHKVQIVKNLSELPKIVTDRRKVLQILINLISNAKYSLSSSEVCKKELILTTKTIEDNKIAISVKDNGMGIESELIDKIFQHGFTTRKDGHGFGLHSAAIAAKELGGELLVKSEGKNKGAEFTLVLPKKESTNNF